MYTYEQVKSIQDELKALLAKGQSDEKYKAGLTEERANNLKDTINQYDTMLGFIGEGGVCEDEKVFEAFKSSEKFIIGIKQIFTAIELVNDPDTKFTVEKA